MIRAPINQLHRQQTKTLQRGSLLDGEASGGSNLDEVLEHEPIANDDFA